MLFLNGLKPINTILTLAFVLNCQPAAYSDETLDAAIRVGQEAEARGDIAAASRQFFNIACSSEGRTYGVMPIEAARLAGRRCLALQLLMYKRSDPSISDRTIESTYTLMRKLEPRNPTWPYLQAQWGLKTGFFDQVPDNLLAAANAPDGPESVRQKARRDLAKFAPQIRNVQTAEIKECDRHFDPVKYRKIMTDVWKYDPSKYYYSPSSAKKEEYGYAPSNNATAAGDYAAADRLMSGNGTSRDVGLYMH